MKKLFRFALAALATAALFVSCEDELKPEENPDDKDQKVELKGISLDKTTATVKVGETATLKVLYNPDNATEKPEATWASDTPAVATVAGGVVTGVTAGEAKITATVGTFTATATVTVTEDAVPSKYPLDLVDWDNLNQNYLVSMELPEGAEKTGLKSAKAYYDDKLYVLLELSDDALTQSKVRFHLYFDIDNSGKLQQHWTKPAIDYMTEGKIMEGGKFVSYSSALFKWNGVESTDWSWADSGLAPTFVTGGKDNLYEMSVDYSAFAANMPVAFNMGMDVADGDYAVFGFLPGTETLARIVKAGQTDPGEEEEDTWDYTPSAEYLAADNLWKDVDAANSVTWFYNPNWNGDPDPAPETSFKESTYTIKFVEEDTAMEWTSQMKIHPTTDLVLDPAKKYTFTAKVYSSTGTHVFFKMYQDGVDWPESFETAPGANRIAVPAGETVEIKVEDFYPLATPQILLIDFAQHGANNTIHVKDITLKVTGEAAAPVEWDYTPSEDYLASNNLWKPVFDDNAEKYFYYHCTSSDWTTGADVLDTTVPFLTKTQSTYELDLAGATGEAWQNQIFIFPDAGREIPLQADKTYKLKVTLGTNVALAPGFFKFSKFDATNAKCEGEAIWEAGSLTLTGAEPTVLEKEISGVECSNIILVMDFGGNPADTKIYIKDITLLAPKDLVKKAEWLFSADAAVADETSYGFTFSAGNPTYKDGKLDSFDAAFTREPGDGGKYVKSNVTEGGLIQYIQIDKAQIDTLDKAARTVGGTGHPFVSGAWPGDYWLFTLGDNDRPEYPAGTKLHIKFITRLSGTGQKYWLLEYWDGAEWKPAAEVKDGSVGEGDAVQNFKYNFEPTTKTSNSTVEVTWTLAAATKTPMFRYTCMANWQANGNGALAAPNGGTCRIAGASGTSPVFEVVEEE